jgi:hypothetical protein
MEIMIAFLLVAALVLAFLCLLVLEYQNVRSKQWHRFWTTHRVVLPPPPQQQPTSFAQNPPDTAEPAKVA